LRQQRSRESAANDILVSKQKRGHKEAGPLPPKVARKPNKKAKISDVVNRHLIVAFIDRNDNVSPCTDDGTGWLKGVRVLKCNDDPTRKWLTQLVRKLDSFWEGAKLEVVVRVLIPSIPKTKVLFPITMQGDRALKLLTAESGRPNGEF